MNAIKAFFQKILGGYLEKKADLYEGSPTEGKVWYRSKTVLSGIAVVLRGLYEGISAVMVSAGKPPLPPVPSIVDTLLLTILGGAAVQGRVDANQPIVLTKEAEDLK